MELKRQLASKPKVDKNEYDRFMMIINEKDEEISEMRREFANRQNDTYSMQEQMRYQNDEINNLKGVI